MPPLLLGEGRFPFYAISCVISLVRTVTSRPAMAGRWTTLVFSMYLEICGGSVYITILFDGSWQKRMGKNSLFGIGGIYGARTNKCIFLSSRCARCATCAVALAKNEDPRPHSCTKNWDERHGKDGAASLMERDIALEGVQALEREGARRRPAPAPRPECGPRLRARAWRCRSVAVSTKLCGH